MMQLQWHKQKYVYVNVIVNVVSVFISKNSDITCTCI